MITIDEADWVEQAQRKRTPNVTPLVRIKPLDIVLYDAEDLSVYTGETETCRKTSMHLLLSDTGQIVQLCPLTAKAWHAGRSYWQGHNGINSFGIGIALPPNYLNQEVWYRLRDLVQALVETYNIRDIVRHSDIQPGSNSAKDFPIALLKPYVEYGNAESAGRYTVAVPENKRLKVRGGPDVRFDEIDLLENGDAVKVLRSSTDGYWYAISYERKGETRSRQGWAFESFLRRA
jgi:N-acetyl-anhydromuramyl-L-alanine amidase AmpD